MSIQDEGPLFAEPISSEEDSLMQKLVGGVEKQRTITTFQLCFMTYFVTCGGPFGIEPAVKAGGPLYTMCALIFITLAWNLPQAVFSAELSLMFPENGGSVLWVQHAFGDFLGYLNAFTNLINSVASQSILIILFAEYIQYSANVNVWQLWLIKIGFVLVITFINIAGVDVISKLSFVFFILIFSPFIGEFIMIFVLGKHETMKLNSLAHVPAWKNFQWGQFISTIVWANGGFDSLGSVAGEVETPSTYVFGVLGSFPIILINYFIPIIIGYLMYPFYLKWNASSFVEIAYSTFTPWLGIWVTVASAISNFAQYNSNTVVISRFVWAMAIGKKSSLVQHRYLPYFLSFSYHNRNGELVPVGGILTAGVLSILGCLFKRQHLVELYLIIRVVNILTEYAAFIWLKYKDPNRPRPFETPFGVVGGVLMLLPTLLIAGVAIFFSTRFSQIVGGSAIVAVGLSYLLKLFWVWLTHKYNFCCWNKAIRKFEIVEPFANEEYTDDSLKAFSVNS